MMQHSHFSTFQRYSIGFRSSDSLEQKTTDDVSLWADTIEHEHNASLDFSMIVKWYFVGLPYITYTTAVNRRRDCDIIFTLIYIHNNAPTLLLATPK